MAPTTATRSSVSPPGVHVITVDCDVHPHLRNGLADLLSYVSSPVRRRLELGLSLGWGRRIYASQFSIPNNVLYVNPVGVMRRDSSPPEGGVPGSDPALVRSQLLDEYGVDRAVLVGGDVFGLGAMPDADIAAALAAAYNDWLNEHWLSLDDRFRGTIVVAPQDPAQAAKEIERWRDRPGMCGIYLPLVNVLMGDRHYYPIYAAAAEHGFPILIHPNSVDGIYVRGPSLAGGVFTYYTEWHTALSEVFHANVISLICQGVFERWPGLRVVLNEGGFAWAPDVIWRLDKDWRSLRDEVPWLRRRPSEYLVDNVRFTTQPLPEPDRPEHLAMLCEIIHAEKTLCFSSDYPHWDFDHPVRSLSALPSHLRDRVRGANAQELFAGRL